MEADQVAVVCSAYFTTSDATESSWNDLHRLVRDADDLAFWMVAMHHEKLPTLMHNLLTAVDQASSTSSLAKRRAISATQEEDVVLMLVRLTTTDVAGPARADSLRSLSRRLLQLLPMKNICLCAPLLHRHSPGTANIIITAVFLCCPGLLCTLPQHLVVWGEAFSRLMNRCVVELQRGRHQRMSGDVVPLMEQTFRLVRQVWALVQSCPCVADYLQLSSILRAMRIAVDVMVPLLQHFLLSCEALANRREIFSKVHAIILNASIETAVVLLMFRSYQQHAAPGADVGTKQQQHCEVRVWCVPSVVEQTYERLVSFLKQYMSGPTLRMVEHGPQQHLGRLMHLLVPPLVDEDVYVGPVLQRLADEIAESKDFSATLTRSRQRFFQLTLMALVENGVSIDVLVAQHFLMPTEAVKLGASEDVLRQCVLGDAASTHTPPPPPTTTAAAADVDGDVREDETSAAVAASHPLVSMVLDIFPFFSPTGVLAALAFYGDDVEQLILDASMENLPPHLVAALHGSPNEDAATAAPSSPPPAGATTTTTTTTLLDDGWMSGIDHIQQNDYDVNLSVAQLHQLLRSDLFGVGDELNEHDDGGYEDVATMQHHEHTLDGDGGAFNIDESMKERIRMLNTIMYEDELDDGAMEDAMLMRNRHLSSSDDDDGPLPATTNADGEAAASGGETGGRPPRDDYHKKLQSKKRAYARTQERKQNNNNNGGDAVPAYAKKAKTNKREAGGGKASLARAIKKGKTML